MRYEFARGLLNVCGLVPVSEVAQDAEIEAQLRMVAATPEERSDILKSAIIVAQCGIQSSELAEVIGRGMTAKWRLIRELEQCKNWDAERIKRRIDEIWEEA